MTKPTFTGLAVATILALSPMASNTASAGSEHLQCHSGFQKVKTFSNSIKCKRVKLGYPTKLSAQHAANNWANSASCNAHMSAPQKKVWKKGSKWKARVTFICANIT